MRKKRSTDIQGFSLAETLLAVLILLLVSTIVATGIPAAKNAYNKVVLASNAEVLLSTSISSLRNELGTAKIVETTDSNTAIVYENSRRGALSKLYLGDISNECSSDTIWIKMVDDGLVSDNTPIRLVSKEASTDDLYVTYTKVTFTGGIITFYNLSVNRESGDIGLAKRDSFSIRNIY